MEIDGANMDGGCGGDNGEAGGDDSPEDDREYGRLEGRLLNFLRVPLAVATPIGIVGVVGWEYGLDGDLLPLPYALLLPDVLSQSTWGWGCSCVKECVRG